MIKIDINKKTIYQVTNDPYNDIDGKFEIFDFPSGCEPHVKFDTGIFHYIEKYEDITIKCKIQSIKDIFVILLVTDALKQMGYYNLSLYIPFVPFARQDRIMVKGEPFSLKVFANIINSQNYKEVIVFDAHSDVTTALIDRCNNYSNFTLVNDVLENKSNYYIVSPDSGAYKKIFKLCQRLEYEDEIILCNKNRDVKTGNITGILCNVPDFNGRDLYIIDDICDGGGTFIMLAEELRKRNCGKIYLIVSHGIFSKGIHALHNIDHIYTTDSITTDFVDIDGKLTIINNI